MRVPTIAGLLLAPIAPTAAIALLFASLSRYGTTASSNFMFMLIVAECVSLILAGPAYILLRRRTQIGLKGCLAVGGVLGALCGVTGIVVGVCSAAIFWWLVVRQGEAAGGLSADATKEDVAFEMPARQDREPMAADGSASSFGEKARRALLIIAKLLLAAGSLAFLAWGAVFIPSAHFPPKTAETGGWVVLSTVAALFITLILRVRLVFGLLIAALSFVAGFASCSANFHWGGG